MDDTEAPSMVLVMGVTGSGKSHFINKLVEGATVEYRGLRSGTQTCQAVQTQIGDTTVAIVDTPGFDDTERSDAEIFSIITKFLTTQYQLGISLRGVIYLHRITDPRMGGTALRNFQIFQKICGEEALKNVVLMTTMWDKLKDEMDGFDRDQELRQDFWSMMEERGSIIRKFDGSKAMAEAMVGMLIGKPPIVLNIQRELQGGRKRLDETSAGRLLVPDLEAKLASSRQHIQYLEQQIEAAEKEQDKIEKERLEKERRRFAEQKRKEEQQRRKMKEEVTEEIEEKIKNEKKKGGFKMKDGIQIFVAITGTALSIVFNLLPIFGII